MTPTEPQEEKAQQLDGVKEAVRGYQFALDMRNNGHAAAYQCVEQIMKLLDMPYVQGEEIKRRGQARKEEAPKK